MSTTPPAKIAVPDHLMRLPRQGSSPDDRMPPLTPAQMTPAQKAAAEQFEKERGMAIGGPFVPLSRSPEVLAMATHIGKYLRTQSPVPTRLSELATLITARRWSQNFEWYAHEAIARHAGLGEGTITAIAEGRHPDGMAEDEAAVFAFCTETHRQGTVCDATYAKAKALLGEHGVIDLVAICGYYTLLAFAMNIARTPLPDGVKPGLTAFPG
jgi:4-carboxymuconolactone decarboxylase